MQTEKIKVMKWQQRPHQYYHNRITENTKILEVIMLKKTSVFFLVFAVVLNLFASQSSLAASTLLSQNKQCTASSNYTGYPASKATDGDLWEGWLADPAKSTASVYVDLGSEQSVNQVKIYWGTYDYAISYKVQTSTNATTWVDKFSTTTGNGGTDEINFTATSARYVRIYCSQKADWSYEIYEMQVYGGSTGAAPTTPTGLTSSNITTIAATLSWNTVTGATGYKLYRGNQQFIREQT